MRKFLLFFGVPFLIFLVVVFLLVNRVVFNDKDPFLSPLQNYLDRSKNPQVSSLDLWLPNLIEALSGDKKPILSAKSALMYDLSENKVLYEKNPKEKLPMASLTKIMTAVIAIENKRDDDRYLVYPENLVGENVMGLTSGEVLSLDELLHGLVLNSGNDAAEVLAANTLGREKFMEAMNSKALALGLKDTNFTNPTGLEGDGIQYTTAYDLLVLTKYALSTYPEFAKVVATSEHQIPATADHKAFDMFNETNLLTTYPGVKGVKDGFTNEAGLCLVTFLDYKDHQIIGVILGSSNRRQEMKDLLDYSLSVQGVKPPPHS